jgi:hypothetical protein
LTADLAAEADLLIAETQSLQNTRNIEKTPKREAAQKNRDLLNFIGIERISGIEAAFRQLPTVAAELSMNPELFEKYYLYKELLPSSIRGSDIKERIRSIAEGAKLASSPMKRLVRAPQALEAKVKDLRLRIGQDLTKTCERFNIGLARTQPALELATRNLEESMHRHNVDILASAMTTESGHKAILSAWVSVVVPLSADLLSEVGSRYREQAFSNSLRELFALHSARESLEAALAKEGAADPPMFAELLAELAVRHPHLVESHVAEMALQGWIELSDNLRVALEIADRSTEGG